MMVLSKKFFSGLIGLVFIFLYSPLNAQVERNSKEKFNVLFIAIDDLNTWIGPLGGHPNTQTPNIDRLAKKGVIFSNAHCQAPLCGPSRASIMTGLRPSTTGIYGMIDDNNIKSDNPVTRDLLLLPEYFNEHGYHTMGIGKLFHQHAPDDVLNESGGRYPGFGPKPEKRFMWEGDGGGAGYGRTSTDWGGFPESDSLMPDVESAEWIVERLNRDYADPFFLAVGFLRPHVPWYVPPHWFEGFDPDQLTLPNYKLDDLNDVPEVAMKINDLPMMPTTEWALESGEYKNIIQAYLACVKFVDAQVGKVLDALESSRYSENTIVVLWSDHGYRLGEKGTFAKHALWEEATKVPLVFAGPNIEGGRVVDQPVELLSIYPTLVEWCGLPAYGRNEGKSLVSLLKDDYDPSVKHYAITTYGENNHSIRNSDFRYNRYEDGTEELYDHRIDPHEWYNRAGDSRYVEIKEQLEKQLPRVNVPWNIHSEYKYQPYFVKQKERSR